MKRQSSWLRTAPLLASGVLAFGSLLRPVAFSQKNLTRDSIPEAPLPAAVVNAKRVFLLNGQTTAEYLTKNGNALAFDTLYADMKTWGKYELVDTPKDADIVVELQYRPYGNGSRSLAADFALVVYEAGSKEQLWSASDACGFARLVKNQQKEVIKSIDRLVDNFKARATPDPR